MIKTLKDFFVKYGTSTTNNFQLERYAKELNIFNFHVLMRDELNPLLLDTLPLSIIINLHKSNQNGVHWSLIYVKNTREAFYFDSYGLPPTEETIKFLKSFKRRICSTFKLQGFEDRYCGVLCLYILFKLNNGCKFENLILDLVK